MQHSSQVTETWHVYCIYHSMLYQCYCIILLKESGYLSYKSIINLFFNETPFLMYNIKHTSLQNTILYCRMYYVIDALLFCKINIGMHPLFKYNVFVKTNSLKHNYYSYFVFISLYALICQMFMNLNRSK